MKWSYKIIRAIVVTLLALLILLPVGAYVALSLPPIERKLCTVGEKELSKLLDANVEIGSLSISPFSQMTFNDVTIDDASGIPALSVEGLGVGIDLYELMVRHKIVVTYTELIGLDAKLTKESQDSPLNIKNIIDALSKKDDTTPPQKFDLRINNIVIRNTQLCYDVLSEKRDSLLFDRNHVKIKNIRADISLPEVKNDDFTIDVNRLAMEEQSGFVVDDIHGLFHITSEGIAIDGLGVSLPNSNLMFSDIGLTYNGWDDLNARLHTLPCELAILDGSYISLSDFSPFVKKLGDMDMKLNVSMSLSGYLDDFEIRKIEVSQPDEDISIDIEGRIKNVTDVDKMDVAISSVSINGYGVDVIDLISIFVPISVKTQQSISNVGRFLFSGKIEGGMDNALFEGAITSAIGDVEINTHYSRLDKRGAINISGSVMSEDFSLRAILGDDKFGSIAANVTFGVTLDGSHKSGTMDGEISDVDYKGYRYQNIITEFAFEDDFYNGWLNITDPNLTVSIDGNANLSMDDPQADIHGEIETIRFDNINIWNKYPGYSLSAVLDANFQGRTIDTIDGMVEITNLTFYDEKGDGLAIKDISVSANNSDNTQRIELQSDLIDGDISGKYSFTKVIPAIKEIVGNAIPILADQVVVKKKNVLEYESDGNKFNFEFVIKENEHIGSFLNLPITIIHPITITGAIEQSLGQLNMSIDAPYLQQKNKLIEETMVHVEADGNENHCLLYATTQYPTKNGSLVMVLSCFGDGNRIDSNIGWQVERERTFKGDVNFSTLFSQKEGNDVVTEVDINRSELIFNDTVWSVNPAKIIYDKEGVSIAGIDVRHENQYITIDGKALPNAEDVICVNLKDVNLDYIFQTLEIEKVMLGGDATGTIYASNLYSNTPSLDTPDLNVKNISYNSTVLGDASIKSSWSQENKAVKFDAEISQSGGEKSYIYGAIFPMNDSLDITFNARNIDVSFMKPYMSAFTSEVSGYASGTARLYGTFKNVDMTGEIFAEDLKLKVDFTNTYYTATDSVHLTPGRITINDITLKDQNGNTAKLNGWLTHEYFKQPVFDFAITEAQNFLSYDMTSKLSPDWYGRIYGNGSVFITGKPGIVNIDVNMTTAPKSTFTYVLSDYKEASDYSFMTFRDLDKINGKDEDEDVVPSVVKRLKDQMANQNDASSSDYNMNFRIDVTPETQIDLVMDPVGGDRIRTNGNGNMQITYNSANEDLRMYGTYTLDKGNYKFTLQDIIIKDFDIREGSSIAFHGDPYTAQLNIEAVYSLNANLSDLDESFLEDKDLNRTNVPVHALLKVSGSVLQPDISFDLEFPTLTQDVDRKVRSIISTEDMMNRQIIYLLALSRFYTPDYMTTTKGNELFSVASSTISSQLSSILGQLSDNWSISPNLRSDRGDFSDIEVDLALSSSLLNNRLLFNGNFGYRDKSLNTNQFIGDFDIEYLLTRRGAWRLKAYNRYNDQNYYIKNATTTQGVGIVFKRDFDNFFSFLKRKKKVAEEAVQQEAEQQEAEQQETGQQETGQQEADSIENKAAPTDWLNITSALDDVK